MDRSQPGYRVVTGRVFNVLLRILGLTEELDTQCGLKGRDRRRGRRRDGALVTERFAFDVEVLARAGRAGLRVEGLPGALVARRGEPGAAGAGRRRDGPGRPCGSAAGSTGRRRRRRGGAGAPARDVMAADAIDAMAGVERDHWWFRAKHRLVLDELRRQHVPASSSTSGAGTGGLLDRLRAARLPRVGHGARHGRPRPRPGRSAGCRSRSRWRRRSGPRRRAGAVTALDVLEHLDDDVLALRELARAVGPGGLVVIAVRLPVGVERPRRPARAPPALQPAAALAAAEAAGLEVLRCTHFHSWLTPVAWLVRRTPLAG